MTGDTDIKLPKQNKWDNIAIKQLLDDTVTKVLEEERYIEDHQLTNYKMILGVISCLIAILSHFYPLPFPTNKLLLIFCCVSYFILSGVLQYIASFKEKDNFVFTHPKQVQQGKEWITLSALKASSIFPKYQDIYTLCIIQISLPDIKLVTKQNKTDNILEKSITSYFDENGYFAEHLFSNDVRQTIKNIEKGKSK